MTRPRWIAPLTVAVALGAGLWIYFWPATSVSPAVAAVPSCVDDPEIVAGAYGSSQDMAPRPESCSKPSGFTATSVVVCEAPVGASMSDPDVVVREITYAGHGLDDVVDAFGARSYKFRIDFFSRCSGDYPNPPVVWLVDDAGRGYRPPFPFDHCGRPNTDAVVLMSGLTVRDDTIVHVPRTD